MSFRSARDGASGKVWWNFISRHVAAVRRNTWQVSGAICIFLSGSWLLSHAMCSWHLILQCPSKVSSIRPLSPSGEISNKNIISECLNQFESIRIIQLHIQLHLQLHLWAIGYIANWLGKKRSSISNSQGFLLSTPALTYMEYHGISLIIEPQPWLPFATTCFDMLPHVASWLHLASDLSFLPSNYAISIYLLTKTLLANRDLGDPRCTRRMSWTQGEHTIRIRSIRNGSFSAHWLRNIGTWSIYKWVTPVFHFDKNNNEKPWRFSKATLNIVKQPEGITRGFKDVSSHHQTASNMRERNLTIWTQPWGRPTEQFRRMPCLGHQSHQMLCLGHQSHQTSITAQSFRNIPRNRWGQTAKGFLDFGWRPKSTRNMVAKCDKARGIKTIKTWGCLKGQLWQHLFVPING